MHFFFLLVPHFFCSEKREKQQQKTIVENFLDLLKRILRYIVEGEESAHTGDRSGVHQSCTYGSCAQAPKTES